MWYAMVTHGNNILIGAPAGHKIRNICHCTGGRIEAPKAPRGWDLGLGRGCPPPHWGF